jgi:hypothetical protein
MWQVDWDNCYSGKGYSQSSSSVKMNGASLTNVTMPKSGACLISHWCNTTLAFMSMHLLQGDTRQHPQACPRLREPRRVECYTYICIILYIGISISISSLSLGLAGRRRGCLVAKENESALVKAKDHPSFTATQTNTFRPVADIRCYRWSLLVRITNLTLVVWFRRCH